MSLPPGAMVDYFSARGDPFARLFAALRDCTPVPVRILVLPYYPQAYYFAERPFAGKMLYATPGGYADAYFQTLQIEALEQNPPAVVLWATEVVFDRDPERAPVRIHARIFDYLSSSFEQPAAIGPFSVFVPRSETEPPAPGVAGCVREAIGPGANSPW